MKKQPVAIDFSLTGLIISILLIGLVGIGFAGFASSISQNYGVPDNTSFINYNQSTALMTQLEVTRNATQIQQQQGVLDVIGGFFSSGYAALQTAMSSYTIFQSMLAVSSNTVPWLNPVFTTFAAIILVGFIIGILLSVLVKQRL